MDVLANPAVHDKRSEAYRQLAAMLDPNRDLEETPSRPLPPIPFERHQAFLQMDPEEHMAMMMMAVDEQLRFLNLPPAERRKKAEEMMRHRQHQL